MLELFLIIMLSMEFSLPDNAELKVVDVSLYCDEIQMDSSSSVFLGWVRGTISGYWNQGIVGMVKNNRMPSDGSMDWLMFQHDPQHTGYTTENISKKIFCLWKFKGDGTPSPPVIANGKLFFVTTAGTVYCLDAVTGNEIWKHETGQSAGFSSSFYVATADGKVYICANNVYCLNAVNGDRIWTYSTPEGKADSPPTIVNDKLYIGADLGGIFCVNATNGFEIWGHETSVWLHSSPAVDGERVYVGFGGESKICCFDADNGTLIWSSRPNWDFDPQTPTIVGSRVYVGSQSDHKIHCLNATNGSEIWNFKTGDLIVSSPAVAYERVYIGSQDYIFYCLNATDGKLLWAYGTNGEIESSPAIADGKVFIVSNDGYIYCLNATIGNKLWEYKIAYKSFFSENPSPVISDGRVYINSWDGNIYCFGEDTSPPLISITFPTPGEILASSSVTASWLVSDPQSGIDHCEVKLDARSWISTNSATNYTFTNLTEGRRMIRIRVLNGAGDLSEAFVSFSVDITPPFVSITSPANNSQLKSSNIVIMWNGSDVISGIDHYEIKLDDGSWIDIGKQTIYMLSDVNDGIHRVEVKAIDKAGLTQEDFIRFIINTSLLGGPGWIDDTVILGGFLAVVALGGIYILKIRKKNL